MVQRPPDTLEHLFYARTKKSLRTTASTAATSAATAANTPTTRIPMPRQSPSANITIDPDLLLSQFEHGVCGVCHHLMDTPTSGCPKGHTFCRACYVTWLERDESCPTCRAKVDGESRLIHNLPLGNIIGDLPMKCKNSAAGCGWTGKVSELKSHLQSCAWVPVRCPIPGCSEQLARHSLEQHVDEAHVPRGESPAKLVLNAAEERAKLVLNAAEERAKLKRGFESRKREAETRIEDLEDEIRSGQRASVARITELERAVRKEKRDAGTKIKALRQELESERLDTGNRIRALKQELESEKRLSTADEKTWVFNWRAGGWDNASTFRSEKHAFADGVQGYCSLQKSSDPSHSHFIGFALEGRAKHKHHATFSILDKHDKVLRQVHETGTATNPHVVEKSKGVCGWDFTPTEEDKAGSVRADGSVRVRVVVRVFLDD